MQYLFWMYFKCIVQASFLCILREVCLHFASIAHVFFIYFASTVNIRKPGDMQRMSEGMSEDARKNVTKKERMTQIMSQRLSERMSEEMQEIMSQGMSERMSQRMAERMTHRMSERMSEEMQERMSQRLTEEGHKACEVESLAGIATSVLAAASKDAWDRQLLYSNHSK